MVLSLQKALRAGLACLPLVPSFRALMEIRARAVQEIRDESALRELIPRAVFHQVTGHPEKVKLLLREPELADSMIFDLGPERSARGWRRVESVSAEPQMWLIRWARHPRLSSSGRWILSVSGAKLTLTRSPSDKLWRITSAHSEGPLWYALTPVSERLGLIPSWLTESSASGAAVKTRAELIEIIACAWSATRGGAA